MSVGAIGSSAWPADLFASGAGSASGVAAKAKGPDSTQFNLFQDHDPENSALTSADRGTIKAMFGIDVRENGDVVSPMSMSGAEYGAAMMAVRAVAHGRATGALTGQLRTGYVSTVYDRYLSIFTGTTPAIGDSGVDVTA